MKIDEEINTPFSTFTNGVLQVVLGCFKINLLFYYYSYFTKKANSCPHGIRKSKIANSCALRNNVRFKPHCGTHNAFYFKTVLIF